MLRRLNEYIRRAVDERGIKLEDATKPIVIELLDTDIIKGHKKSHRECIFACAAKRLDGVRAAYFYLSTAWLEYDKKAVRYLLPASVQKEIVSFDRSGVTKPGFYQLSSVHASQRSGYNRGLRKPNRKSKSKSRRLRHRTEDVRSVGKAS